ncbi:AraC family transcriptional regulator [Rhodococcus triatomae BKS 15-14]|nr:AraC family transcriptional regulator [Rhodococcus triatomae BKS 15-14]
MHTRLRSPTWESPAQLPSGDTAGMYRECTFPGIERCASGIAGPVASHAETEEHVQEWNRAIDLIEQRLEGDLDISDIARVALTSEYHFRRMFSTLAGMPLSEYVRRRRLTVATADVLAGEPVVDVAVRFGYGSAAAFTRAFKSMHGLTPGQARQPGSVLRSQPPLRFHLRVEGSCV